LVTILPSLSLVVMDFHFGAHGYLHFTTNSSKVKPMRI
jgi:hypothetical protein